MDPETTATLTFFDGQNLSFTINMPRKKGN